MDRRMRRDLQPVSREGQQSSASKGKVQSECGRRFENLKFNEDVRLPFMVIRGQDNNRVSFPVRVKANSPDGLLPARGYW
jgi:hypothetical protein